jgi:hypothetical protein
LKGVKVRRSLLLFAVALVMALGIPAAAAAAPASTTFAVSGYEYAFTPTVGCFAGTAGGNAGDRAAWNTCVEHDPLGSEPTYINGGRFAMATRSPAGSYDYVTGTFVFHGGTVETIDPGVNCTNQRYLVSGALENVSTSTTSGGSGTFAATLTHYRARFFGRCIAYRATVVGTASFVY